MTSPQGPAGSHPPGWYDDPNMSGAARYWDGRQWAPPGGPGAFAQGPRLGPKDLITQANAGRRAALALWIGVGCHAVQVIATATYLHEFWEQFNKLLSSTSTRTRGAPPTMVLSGSAQAAQGVSQLAGLGSLVVYVIFLIWFHRAATTARDLGVPARRSPGWAIGGWFIPFGNLFLPYQSASDLFPPGHEDRKVVGPWWGFYLGSGFAAGVVYAASFASAAAGLVACVLPIGLYVMAALKGRQMIARSLALHTDMARHFALVPPGFDPAAPAADVGPYGTGQPSAWTGAERPTPDPWSPS